MFRRPAPHVHRRGLPAVPEISEARFKRFLKDLETYEKKLSFEHTLDAFLDLYSTWKRTQDQRLKLRLVMLAFELHRLDKRFQCDLEFNEREEERCS